LCGEHPTQTELIDYEAFCGIPVDRVADRASGVPEISVTELKSRFDRGEPPYVLDVRHPEEYAISNLGSHLIPLDELPGRLNEIRADREEEIVVMCRSGVRSAHAVELLRDAGYQNAVNLAGGILAWSNEIDPSIVTY
jgi:adenylyltransferase/sulfurtransferase